MIPTYFTLMHHPFLTFTIIYRLDFTLLIEIYVYHTFTFSSSSSSSAAHQLRLYVVNKNLITDSLSLSLSTLNNKVNFSRQQLNCQFVQYLLKKERRNEYVRTQVSRTLTLTHHTKKERYRVKIIC